MIGQDTAEAHMVRFDALLEAYSATVIDFSIATARKATPGPAYARYQRAKLALREYVANASANRYSRA